MITSIFEDELRIRFSLSGQCGDQNGGGIGLVFPMLSAFILSACLSLTVQLASAQPVVVAEARSGQSAMKAVSSLVENDLEGALRRPVTFSVEELSLGEALQEAARQGEVGLSYNPSLVPEEKKVFVDAKSHSLLEALRVLLKGTDLKALISPNQDIILIERGAGDSGDESSSRTASSRVELSYVSSDETFAGDRKPQHIVEGQVTDAETGETLPGVNVVVQGTQIGTTTDPNGQYSIDAPDGTQTLVFSFVGYETQEVPIQGRTNIDVALAPSFSEMEEVVVVGYGEQRRRDITGSVSSVTAEDIDDVAALSFEEAIQGQISGVQINERSGAPGATPEIQIRGTGSITGGTDPLFVVDGMPLTKNTDLQGTIDTRREAFTPPSQNPLAAINPRDIESIEVLKDAAAASIYGSRGSNGVVMITTKTGTEGTEPRVTFSQRFGRSSVANRPDMMNSEEWVDFVVDSRNNNFRQKLGEEPPNPRTNEGRPENDGFVRIPERAIKFDQGEIDTNTDWIDAIYEPGLSTTSHLSVAGGGEGIGYFVSGGVTSENGTIEGSRINRFTLKTNVRGDIADPVRFGVNLNLSRSDQDRVPASGPYFGRPPGIPYSAQTTAPIVEPFNDDGTPNQGPGGSAGGSQAFLDGGTTSNSNPFAIRDGINEELSQDRIFGTFTLEYDLLVEGLTLDTRFGVDVQNYKRDFFRRNSLLFRTAREGDPLGQSNSSNSVNWLTEGTLNYESEIGDHSFTGLAGITAQRQRDETNRVIAQNFPDDAVETINAGQVTRGNSRVSEWSLLSTLGRGTYNYQDRFLVTATVRADKSSRFGPDNQTGVFPSGSVGWRISEEDFMQGVDYVEDLKFRFSVGQTGNFQIPDDGAFNLLGSADYPQGGEREIGLAQTTLGDKGLSWETTTEFNTGIDASFLDNRVEFFGEYYYAETDDLLLNVAVPAQTGFTEVLTNIGTVVNEGVEFELTTRNFTGDFTWDTSFLFSTNRNEVTALGPGDAPIRSVGAAGIRHITQVGSEIGSYWGFVTDGVFQSEEEIANAPEDQLAPDPQPGDLRFKDVNGDGEITQEDRTVTGSYQPDWSASLENEFQWKGVDFSMLWDATVGRDILALTHRHMFNGEANFNSFAEWNNRWRSPEEPGNGEIPRADRQTGLHGNNNRPSDFQVENGTSLRLRNVTLGYSLGSIFGGAAERARVYFIGRNLVTVTPYINFNPDASLQTNPLVTGEDYGAFPISRNFTVGVDMTF